MKWFAYNGSLSLKDGIPSMESTQVSTLSLHFDDGLDFLNFVNNFVIPTAKKYGYDIKLAKLEETKPEKITLLKRD